MLTMCGFFYVFIIPINFNAFLKWYQYEHAI